MTITLDFTPTEQARITAAAQQSGLDPQVFLKQIVTEHLPEVFGSAQDGGYRPAPNGVAADHFYFTATREEFNRALDDISRMNEDLPVLSDAAFDR